MSSSNGGIEESSRCIQKMMRSLPDDNDDDSILESQSPEAGQKRSSSRMNDDDDDDAFNRENTLEIRNNHSQTSSPSPREMMLSEDSHIASQSLIIEEVSAGATTDGWSTTTQQQQQYNSQTQATQPEDSLTQQVMTQPGEFSGLSPLPAQPLPPFSPPDPRKIPWGRLLLPYANANHAVPLIELLPRDPSQRLRGDNSFGESLESLSSMTTATKVCGLTIGRGEIFNEYILGRSPSKCDIVIPKPPKSEVDSREQRIQDWAWGVISNAHCKIFCQLVDDGSGVPMNDQNLSAAFSNYSNNQNMVVYIEDTSVNGTRVNTVLLRRGQKRRLHPGDEICLVQPTTLRKKIRSSTVLTQLLQQYTFVFMNGSKQHTMDQQQQLLSPRPAAVNVRALAGSPTHQRSPFAGQFAQQQQQQPRRCGRPTTTLAQKGANVASSERRIEQDYDIRDVLGSGTVGEVRRAIHRQSGEERAVKIIRLQPKGRLQRKSSGTAVLQAEAAILKTLQHPYIVQLYDVYVCHNSIFLVMELLQGGDLFDRIVHKGKYTETESRRVMRRLLSALYYLHEEEQVVHRDLKPENILLQSRSDDISIKLTDFGLAKTIDERQGLQTFCGTPQYFAPEVLSRQHTVAGRGRYGKQADLWSVGVILHILLSGMPPFDGGDVVESGRLPELQLNGEAFEGVSPEALDLVQRLLVQDPSKRLNVLQACRHEWINIPDGDTHTFVLDDPAWTRAANDGKSQPTATAGTSHTNDTDKPKTKALVDKLETTVSPPSDPETTTDVTGKSVVSATSDKDSGSTAKNSVDDTSNQKASRFGTTKPVGRSREVKAKRPTTQMQNKFNPAEQNPKCGDTRQVKVSPAPNRPPLAVVPENKPTKRQAVISISQGQPVIRLQQQDARHVNDAKELSDDGICSVLSDVVESIGSFEGKDENEPVMTKSSAAVDAHVTTPNPPKCTEPSRKSRKRRRVTSSIGEIKEKRVQPTVASECSMKQQTLAMWFKARK